MEKLSLSQYLLDTVTDKITSIKISPTLPILWVGEKTPPKVVGWGRMVKIVFTDSSVSYYVQRVIRLVRPTKPRWGETHIVIGGTSPTPFTPKSWGWAVRDEVENLSLNYDILIPSGVGKKTIVLLGKKETLEGFSEVSEFEGELYNPPELYKISVKDKRVVEVKLIRPKI